MTARDKAIAAAEDDPAHTFTAKQLKRTYAIAFERGRKLEREDCAKVCESRIGGAIKPSDWWVGFKAAMKQCAEAIRARETT